VTRNDDDDDDDDDNNNNNNNNKATLALFLDIERAFDKFWITGLIYELIKEGIPAHFTHIIHNYLRNRLCSC
jgi:hypothetical protein